MEAIIYWKTKEEGGRSNLPSGEGTPSYAAIIRFVDSDDSWPPEESWSLIVEKKLVLGDYTWVADIRFLAENAPAEFLRLGRKFELYEGSKCVASGVIKSATGAL